MRLRFLQRAISFEEFVQGRVIVPSVFLVSIPRYGDNRDKRYKRYKSNFADCVRARKP
jgi:hypothetical protein